MNDILKILFGIICILSMTLFIIGIVILGVSENICHSECDKEHALTYDLTPGGGLSIDNDICTCYGDDWVKSFRLGEKK